MFDRRTYHYYIDIFTATHNFNSLFNKYNNYIRHVLEEKVIRKYKKFTLVNFILYLPNTFY